jgi:hypothetical protein
MGGDEDEFHIVAALGMLPWEWAKMIFEVELQASTLRFPI